ncbi:MAG: 30S ribosomal protein S6e [Candidatus Diapherotrites archaeon]
MNIVLSDPKSGKAYSKKIESVAFMGKKLGETVSLETIGLKGYKAIITGGSDKDGFPMKPSVEGQSRKKILMSKGIGIKGLKKGEKRRKRVRGNTVAKDIHQLNLKITEYGPESLAEIFKKTGEEKKEEAKDEKKAKKEPAKE